jgi:hypothetical protein
MQVLVFEVMVEMFLAHFHRLSGSASEFVAAYSKEIKSKEEWEKPLLDRNYSYANKILKSAFR